MIKPSFKNKPEWANYLAQDESGVWSWFQDMPKAERGCARGYWSTTGRYENVSPESQENWYNTLQEV